MFDTVRHARLLPIRDNDALSDVIEAVLRSSDHLAPTLAFKVLSSLPQLPDLQVAVWTEPLHGVKVFPTRVGAGALDVCTINLPLDATPHEAAIHIALHCAGHDRLQYHIAHGHHVLSVEGRIAAPFVPWQLATVDCGIICSSPSAASSAASTGLTPAESIVPVQVEESRVAVRSSEVMVYQRGLPPTLVQADPNSGPQHLLERLIAACRLRGSICMSLPAIMPVSNPLPSSYSASQG